MRITKAGFPLPAVHHVIRGFGLGRVGHSGTNCSLARLRIEKLCQDLRVVTGRHRQRHPRAERANAGGRYRRFAKLKREEGKSLVEAALEGAKLRLRPILMTSLAFILGCRAADARERLWCRLTRCHGHRSRVWYDHRDP